MNGKELYTELRVVQIQRYYYKQDSLGIDLEIAAMCIAEFGFQKCLAE